MPKIEIGTAGWDYKDWSGPFYPKGLERSQQLKFFSEYFELVEINSTFYNVPSIDMVKNWNKRVPDHFRFVIKVWQEITHQQDITEISSNIQLFFSRLSFLNEKIKAFLLQFPPWFNYSENHLEMLKFVLNEVPLEYKYIIELRHNSWFDPKILTKFIDGNKKILGTTYKPGIIAYYMENQNYYYIRLIGDRELTVFNRLQREQKEALEHLYQNIERLLTLPNIYEIFIIINNHFAGFAPESVNALKQRWALPHNGFNAQKNLLDFLRNDESY